MKKYRGYLVTEIQKKIMKAYRKQGLSYKEIAANVGFAPSTVQYWTDKQYHDRVSKKNNENGKARYKKNPKQTTDREYRRKYQYERYNNDEEYRQRMLGYVKKYQAKKQKEKNERKT